MAKKQNRPQPAAAPVRPQPVSQSPRQPKVAERKPPMPLVRKLCIILAIISAVVYVNTMQGGFVLDDVMVIKENTYVREGFSGIGELLKTPHLKGHMDLKTDTYRPLSLVTYAMEFGLFGENTTVGHFMNIVTFIGCVLLLFLFLYNLFDKKRVAVAFMTALLFAVHPIHVEVVANIKSRDELLCFFFAFLSLNLWLKYMREGKALWLGLGAFSLFLSFLSKETVITFIGVVPLVFLFYRNDNKMRAISIAASALVVAGIFLGMRQMVLNAYDANHPYVVKFLDNFLAGAPSGASRIATAIMLLGYYLQLMFVPQPLLCDYSYHTFPFVSFGNKWVLLSLVVYAGGIVVAIMRLMKDRKDPWAFGILFYLMTISLFSNIPFLVGAAVADRFAFFASAGTCMLIALAIEKWLVGNEQADMKALTASKGIYVVGALALIYAGITISRNGDWHDNYTLYKTDVAKKPENTRLNYYMGAQLQKMYDETNDPARQKEIIDEALKYLCQSLNVYPDNVDSHAEIGATYFRAHQYDSAVKHLERALQMNPRQVNACTNLGTVYLTQSRFTEALPYYRKTVSINPQHVLGWFNLGVCYAQTMKYDSSVFAFKKTIELNPDYLNHKATEYTAMIYKMMGKMDSASKWEGIARQYNPGFKN